MADKGRPGAMPAGYDPAALMCKITVPSQWSSTPVPLYQLTFLNPLSS